MSSKGPSGNAWPWKGGGAGNRGSGCLGGFAGAFGDLQGWVLPSWVSRVPAAGVRLRLYRDSVFCRMIYCGGFEREELQFTESIPPAGGYLCGPGGPYRPVHRPGRPTGGAVRKGLRLRTFGRRLPKAGRKPGAERPGKCLSPSPGPFGPGRPFGVEGAHGRP